MLASQCQLARAVLKLSIAELAKKAGVSQESIAAFEDGREIDGDTAMKMQDAFEASGVEFTFGDRPGLRLRTLDGIIEVSASPLAKTPLAKTPLAKS